jgi:hypothetical protein
LHARSRMVAAAVPAPMEKLQQSLQNFKMKASLSRSRTPDPSVDRIDRHQHRPPFDQSFNTGSNSGFGPADGVGMRAASAAAGGGHTQWNGHQTLSPDRRHIHRLVESNGRKFLNQMYTREIRASVFQGEHWARHLPPKEKLAEESASGPSLSAEARPAEEAPPEQIPHYLHGSGNEILRQAINDANVALMVADNDKQKHVIAGLRHAYVAAKLRRKMERAKKRAREDNLKKKMSTMQEREGSQGAMLQTQTAVAAL